MVFNLKVFSIKYHAFKDPLMPLCIPLIHSFPVLHNLPCAHATWSHPRPSDAQALRLGPLWLRKRGWGSVFAHVPLIVFG